MRREKRLPRSRIGVATKVTGTLTFTKQLLICGEFNGHIRGGELLVVGKEARVDADITVDTLIVRGRITGQITARTAIMLESSSVVGADIHTKDIWIASNAQYHGRCVTAS